MQTKLEIESKWDEILAYMKQEYNLSNVSFRTWLLPLKVYDVEDNMITIIADDSVINANNVGFIRAKYTPLFKVAISEIMQRDFEVDIVPQSQIMKREKENDKKKIGGFSSYGGIRMINPHYTFDSFVVGDNNNTAHAAALAVAEDPGKVYNPLYIYGGAGLGKTHLMYAIANFVTEYNPEMKVLYVTSETFTNDLVKAIKAGGTETEEFRMKYRSNDILLIDDIQFIINKERTQEEFFHTFNEMKDSGRQVIISSDKHPKELQILDERLSSRFKWGLTVDIQAPAFETRMAILRKKQEINRLTIPDEILNYIAINISTNIRELEGALTKVVALSRLQKKEITLSLAQEALKDIISPDAQKSVTLPLILNVVAEHYNITPEQIISKNKSRNIAYPRQVAMYLCRELTPLSFDEIGRDIGNRDHSTVHYAYTKVTSDIATDTSIANTVDVLKKKINPQ